MFGLFSQRRHPVPTSRPTRRATLNCERLDDRITPTTEGHFSGGFVNNGTFTFDETVINPDLPEQDLTLNDFDFYWLSIHFTASTNPVAKLVHGDYDRIESFVATPDSSGAPTVTITVNGNTATVYNHTSQTTSTQQVDVNIDTRGVRLDFNWVTRDRAYKILLIDYGPDGKIREDKVQSVEIGENADRDDVIRTVKDALEAMGYGVTIEDDTKLRIIPPKGVRSLDYDTLNPDDKPNTNLSGPEYISRWGGAFEVKVNGTKITP